MRRDGVHDGGGRMSHWGTGRENSLRRFRYIEQILGAFSLRYEGSLVQETTENPVMLGVVDEQTVCCE